MLPDAQREVLRALADHDVDPVTSEYHPPEPPARNLFLEGHRIFRS